MRRIFAVANISTNTKDDKFVYGISAAASFLECAESTVQRHADARRLKCKRDASGRRLFSLSVLRAFKESGTLRGWRRIPAEDRVH
jgi:hypothetical protein